MKLLGLRFDRVAFVWLLIGLLGAMVFGYLRAIHLDGKTLLAFVIIGALHWTGGVCFHAIIHNHIQVIRRDIWNLKNLQDSLFLLGIIAMVLSVGYVGYSFPQGITRGPLFFLSCGVCYVALTCGLGYYGQKARS